MNVPETDGKLLYDIVLKNNYKKALELGTSTGHSGIYIARVLSKTGGKLITVEIDEGRYRQALANFKEAEPDWQSAIKNKTQESYVTYSLAGLSASISAAGLYRAAC